MNLDLIVAIIGLVLIFASAIHRWYTRSQNERREQDRDLSRLTGGKRWWKEPPGDGPEGDH
jgi:hypothetical protein